MLNKAWNKHVAWTTKDGKQTEGVWAVKWLWQIEAEMLHNHNF